MNSDEKLHLVIGASNFQYKNAVSINETQKNALIRYQKSDCANNLFDNNYHLHYFYPMAFVRKIKMQQMVTLLQAQRWQLTNKKLLLPITLFVLLFLPTTYEVTKTVLAEAFWQVSAYVAATLIGYHFISQWLAHKSGLKTTIYKTPWRQIVFASFLGALPGCGGAIIVVTQFVRRQMNFGSLVAVLTSTMGDAAFLLLATKPVDGFIMMLLGIIVGSLSGIIIHKIHGNHFLHSSLSYTPKTHTASSASSSLGLYVQGQFWRYLYLPAFVIALMMAFQIDVDSTFSLPSGSADTLGMMLSLISTLLWAFSHKSFSYQSAVANTPKETPTRLFEKAAQDTNFVSCWVIIAFLSFELTVLFTGFDLSMLFSNYLLLIPMLAALVGLVPGCGPQILVTSLYIQGLLPFSAQIANGLSNDGDALFPAIALAPKAAIIATLYSVIPAVIFSYIYLFLFE